MPTPQLAVGSVVSVAWLAACVTASALPPLGLTRVSEQSSFLSSLSVIDGVAYVSTPAGVYPLDATGVGSPIVPTPPVGYSDLMDTTRVVVGPGGLAHFAAEFASGPSGPGEHLFATYSIADPTSAISPGLQLFGPGDVIRRLGGIDSSLRVLVNDGFGNVLELFADGTSRSEALHGTDFVLEIAEVAPNGVAAVVAAIPNTLGAAGALLLPNGRVSFLGPSGGFGSVGSIKVTENGSMNIGTWADRHYVAYGDEPPIGIDASIDSSWNDGQTLVSESRFTVIADCWFARDPDHRAFFPGISDEGLDQSVPLESLFPELRRLDYDHIVDMTSQEGQIHLLLTGPAGLWLFAAPDPSLIPEPTALVLVGLAIAVASGGHRQRR